MKILKLELLGRDTEGYGNIGPHVVEILRKKGCVVHTMGCSQISLIKEGVIYRVVGLRRPGRGDFECVGFQIWINVLGVYEFNLVEIGEIK